MEALALPSPGVPSGAADAASKDVSCLDKTKLGLSYGPSRAGSGAALTTAALSHLPSMSLPVRGQHPLQRPHDECLRGELQGHRSPDDQVSAATAVCCGEPQALPGPMAQLPWQPNTAESPGSLAAFPCAQALGCAVPSMVIRSANYLGEEICVGRWEGGTGDLRGKNNNSKGRWV